MADDRELFLNAALEEYRSLREESRQASINMITSLSIGMGAAALAAAVGINFWLGHRSNIPMYIFGLIIPFLLALVISFWLGEVARFKRVGNYICSIELKVSMLLSEFYKENLEEKWSKIQEKIEKEFNFPHTELEIGRPMVWEQWLRVARQASEKEKGLDRWLSTSGHMPWIYAIRLGLQIIAFIGSFSFGGYYILKYIGLGNISVFWKIIIFLVFAIYVVFVGFVSRQAWKINKE